MKVVTFVLNRQVHMLFLGIRPRRRPGGAGERWQGVDGRGSRILGQGGVAGSILPPKTGIRRPAFGL